MIHYCMMQLATPESVVTYILVTCSMLCLFTGSFVLQVCIDSEWRDFDHV